MGKFTVDSQIVKSYVRLLRSGKLKNGIEDVPDMDNLREVVKSVLDSELKV